MSISPLKYADSTSFEKKIDELLEFRNTSSKQRILLASSGSQYTIQLGAKKGFWQRVCDFFYKPRHLRLTSILDKTVLFLDANKEFFRDEKIFRKLLVFNQKLCSISHFKQKVSLASSFRLKSLVEEISEKHLENHKNKDAFISVAFAKFDQAKENQAATQKEIAKIRESSKLRISATQDKINELQNATGVSFNSTLKKLYLARTKQKLIFFTSDLVSLYGSLLSDKRLPTDLTFICKENRKVLAHQLFFPEFMKTIKTKSKKIEIDFSDFYDVEIKKLLSLCYGEMDKYQGLFFLQDFIRFYLLSQRLQLHISGVTNQCRLNFEGLLKKDSYIALYALEVCSELSYSPEFLEQAQDPQSLEYICLSFLFERHEKEWEIPRESYKKINPFLKNFKHALSDRFIEKLEKDGLT